MFRLRMLPAAYGDSLILEYGTNAKKPRRVLIDCGIPGSFKTLSEAIEELPENQRRFELFVISHIDSDHIGGSLPLLENREELGVEFDDIWFNGYKHLDPDTDDVLGGVQGEKLTSAIMNQGLNWNEAFSGKSVVVPEKGKLPVKKLAGGLTLTLLSPTWNELERLKPKWEAEVIKAGLKPGVPAKPPQPEPGDDVLGGTLNVDKLASTKFSSDSTKPNASSIVLLAEYDGSSVLLGADGQVPVLLKTVPRLTEEKRKKIRWMKVPHHGSRGNISNELLKLIPSKNFLVSSNGKIYNHPDKEAIARAIKSTTSSKFFFNYRTDRNDMWDDKTLMKKHKYSVRYPTGKSGGITVDL